MIADYFLLNLVIETQVEELKNDLDDLEAFVEPVIDKIVKM